VLPTASVDRTGHSFYFSTVEFPILAWREDGVWSVISPSVPGVFGLGKTRKAAEKDFTDALATLLAYLREIGEKPPRASAIYTGTVSV
jgi:predicted RNase H-like HicB family nuclease